MRGKILHELRTFTQPIEGRDGDWLTCSFRPETTPVRQFVNAFWEQVVAPALEPIDVTLFDLSDPEDAAALKGAEVRRAALVSEVGMDGNLDAAQQTIELDLSMSGTGVPLLHDGFASAYRWADRINELATGGTRPAPSNLMIIIDQFEELFRNRVSSDEAQALCSMIRHAHRRGSRQEGVYVAVSMRSEDIHRCAEIEGLADIVNSSVVLVDWLNRNDLSKAIVDPARIVLEDWGIAAEFGGSNAVPTAPYHPDVVSDIVAEVDWLARSLEHKADHLPLLQHGLHELWLVAAERWSAAQKAGDQVSLAVEERDLVEVRRRCRPGAGESWLQAQLRASAHLCYHEACAAYDWVFGDAYAPVSAAVALRAVLCEMASRDENGKIHRDFAVVSDVVRERLLPESTAAQREAVCRALIQALKVFSKRQLLVELSSKDVPAYDVTHEALIRNWPQMLNWLDEDSQLLSAYRNSVREPEQKDHGQEYTFNIEEQYVPYSGLRVIGLGLVEYSVLGGGRRFGVRSGPVSVSAMVSPIVESGSFGHWRSGAMDPRSHLSESRIACPLQMSSMLSEIAGAPIGCVR